MARHERVGITDTVYPWISVTEANVPTVAVTISNEVSFLYGSIIRFNNSLRKISDTVSRQDSVSMQRAMFGALPSILRGERHRGVSKIGSVLVASSGYANYPSLIFAVEARSSWKLPLVLRVCITRPEDFDSVLDVMGIVQATKKRRNRR